MTYSNNSNILLDVPAYPDVDEDPFTVSITPNPVKGNMTITTDYTLGRVSVHVLKAQGVDVKGFNMKESVTIDMSDLPAGSYFVNLIGGKVVTKKNVVE